MQSSGSAVFAAGVDLEAAVQGPREVDEHWFFGPGRRDIRRLMAQCLVEMGKNVVVVTRNQATGLKHALEEEPDE